MKRYIKNSNKHSVPILNSVSTRNDVDTLNLGELLEIKRRYTRSDGSFGAFSGHEEVEYFMSVVLRLDEEFGYDI